MTDDRQNDDDEHLKSLRQVWLSMRDEDPPASGLDALMAAARSHVEVLAKPTLWQRIIATLRQPPVLAFATVVVLIGGVVLVTRHDDVLERAPTAPAVIETDKPAPVNLGVHGAPPVMQPPRIETTTGNQEVVTPRSVPQHHVTPSRKEAAKASTSNGFTADPDATQGGATLEAAPSADAKKDESPNEVLVEQLASQAHSAVTRGDCETARSIGARIARQDASYYRDHVATELANCH